jgi:hypothetical protein
MGRGRSARRLHRDAHAGTASLSRCALRAGRACAEAIGALPVGAALGIDDARAARPLGASLPTAALTVGRAGAARPADAGKSRWTFIARWGAAIGESRARATCTRDARFSRSAVVHGFAASPARARQAGLSGLAVGLSRTRTGPVLALRTQSGTALAVRGARPANAFWWTGFPFR